MKKSSGSKWFTLIMAVVVVYFATVLISQQVRLAQVSESQHIADKRLAVAQEEHDRLVNEYVELQDLTNIERIAREDLGLAKDGELPYQISSR